MFGATTGRDETGRGRRLDGTRQGGGGDWTGRDRAGRRLDGTKQGGGGDWTGRNRAGAATGRDETGRGRAATGGMGTAGRLTLRLMFSSPQGSFLTKSGCPKIISSDSFRSEPAIGDSTFLKPSVSRPEGDRSVGGALKLHTGTGPGLTQ